MSVHTKTWTFRVRRNSEPAAMSKGLFVGVSATVGVGNSELTKMPGARVDAKPRRQRKITSKKPTARALATAMKEKKEYWSDGDELKGDTSLPLGYTPPVLSKGGDGADGLQDIYTIMAQNVIAGSDLTRGKTGRSFWSRKPIKTLGASSASLSSDATAMASQADEKDVLAEKLATGDHPIPFSSIIPDPLGELPAWFIKEHDGLASPIISHRVRYPIHNPYGPRWYRNWHLIPSSQLEPGTRPTSFFSPAFPHMSPKASSYQPSLMPMSPATASSPLSPDSSQTGLADGQRMRTRKTSQTAHDGVDLLDLTDPQGTNWHHQSPYDPGLASHPVTTDLRAPEPVAQVFPQPRSRMSSMTGRHNPLNPSPLSQSTSAVHLHAEVSAPSSLGSRKLSKRRKASETSNASGQGGDTEEASSPFKEKEGGRIERFIRRTSLSMERREPASRPPSSRRDSKRSSVLGKIAKKFSISRRSTRELDNGRTSRNSAILAADWQHVQSSETRGRSPVVSQLIQCQPSPPKPTTLQADHAVEPEKQVVASPPPIEAIATPPAEPEVPREADDSISLEEPFTMGKLTVANPDDNDSSMDETSPSTPVPTVQQLDHSPAPQLPLLPPATLLKTPSFDNAIQTVVVTPRASQRLSQILPVVPGPAPPSPPKSKVSQTLPTGTTEPPPSPPKPSRRMSFREDLPPLPPPERPFAIAMQSPSPSQRSGPFTTQHMYASTVTLATEFPRLSAAPTIPDDSSSLMANPPSLHLPSESSPPPVPSKRGMRTPSPTKPRIETPALRDDNVRTRTESRRSIREPSPQKMKPEAPPVRDEPPQQEQYRATREQSPQKPRVEIPRKDDSLRVKMPSAVTARETETFRLVRTPSDNLRQSILLTANGEQWAVVESESPKRRTKERESPTKVSSTQSHLPRSAEKDSGDRRDRGRSEREGYREREKEEERRREKERVREMDREREREEERRREKERALDADKEREREERRRRERERGRESDREREREDVRRKERDRGREGEKERERERRKEKEREHSGGQERESDVERRRERERRKEKERERERQREREATATKLQAETVARPSSRTRKASKEHVPDKPIASTSGAPSRARSMEVTSTDVDRKSHHRREERSSEDRRAREPPEDKYSESKRERREDRTSDDQRERHVDRSSREKKKHDKERSDRSERKHERAASEEPVSSKPRQSSAEPETGLSRRPSTSTRPTSEQPSAEQLNAMRAREVWEMERLWKGRSMHMDPSSVGNLPFTSPPPLHASLPSHSAPAGYFPMVVPPYGSAHTSFMVQNQFPAYPQAAHVHPVFYPQSPDPALNGYSSTSSLPQSFYTAAGAASHPDLLSHPNRAATAPPSRPQAPNPLPEPPRESDYKPTPIPALNDARRGSADHWTKYTNVAPAH